MKNYKNLPSPLLSLLPIAVLVAMLAITIYLFGSDALGGGSQVCLLAATGMCVFIGMIGFKRKWKDFENSSIDARCGRRHGDGHRRPRDRDADA